MLKTFELLNKYTFEISKYVSDNNLKLFPYYFVIINSKEYNQDEITNVIPLKCSVCLDDITNNLYKTECNHYFHISCFEKWLDHNTNCPMCRHSIEYTKIDFKKELIFLSDKLKIPVKNFKLKINQKYINFTQDDFTKLYNCSPILSKNVYKDNNIYFEPVFKLGKFYISSWLRNTILFSNKNIIDNIIYKNDYSRYIFLDCYNYKFNKGFITYDHFIILYDWIYKVMCYLKKYKKGFAYDNIMDTKIFNIFFSYIYYNDIKKITYQKLACVAMYLAHKEEVELSFFKWVSDGSSTLEELKNLKENIISI